MLQPWAAAVYEGRMAKDDPNARCMPLGVPRYTQSLFKILQASDIGRRAGRSPHAVPPDLHRWSRIAGESESVMSDGRVTGLVNHSSLGSEVGVRRSP